MLAGGRSRRFGGDKLVASYQGRPLLHLPIEAVAAVCTEVIVAVAPETEPTLPDVGPPIRIAHDAREGDGPLSGLLAALRLTWTSLAVVVGGDMPELHPGVLEGMLRVTQARDDLDAVVLSDSQGPHPLPVVIRVTPTRQRAITLMRPGGESGTPGLRNLLVELNCIDIPEEDWKGMDPFGGTLRDVDVPGDLR